VNLVTSISSMPILGAFRFLIFYWLARPEALEEAARQTEAARR
jgi:hypothetical protein